jgi:choline kinase
MTKSQTKCMVSLNGTTLIERSLDSLVATESWSWLTMSNSQDLWIGVSRGLGVIS